MTGSIDLIAGGFDIGDDDLENIMDFFENGYLEFDANNISANMTLEIDLSPGFNPHFTAQLPDIPLGAIAVCSSFNPAQSHD